MTHKVTNTSKAPQGVHTEDGRIVFVGPGGFRTIAIAVDYLERAKSLPFLTVEEVNPRDDFGNSIISKRPIANPLDHDNNGKSGGAHPAVGEGYDGVTVPKLKELAAERGVDLGDARKREDIVAALQLADEVVSKIEF